MISTLDVAFVPFRNLLFRVHLKRKSSASLFPKYTHGGFLTHLALPAYLWHVFFYRFTLPLLPFRVVRKLCLCSTLLLFRCASRAFRVRSTEPRQDNKKPESRKAASSGSLHKLWPLVAWVCCPLVGSS